MERAARCLSFLWLVVIVVGCTREDINQKYPSDKDILNYGYRLNQLEPKDGGDVFIVLALSGGGMRAAALSYGVLEKLNQSKYVRNGRTRSLLDEVDIITAVSGGSVVAAYFALYGKEILPGGKRDFKDAFLKQDIMSELVLGFLNPITWARLASPNFDRIDVLTEAFDRHLYEGKTFGDLLSKKTRPLIMLNAADISTGAVFYFTQDNFDSICSDLKDFPLAKAVAASAAFPVFLSPIMLKNYSGDSCPIKYDSRDKKVPTWVEMAKGNSTKEKPGDRYINFNRFKRALLEEELHKGDDAFRKPEYIHLFDGGLADNLGLRAPLLLLRSTDPLSSITTKVFSGKIKKFAVIVVNASKHPDSALDHQGWPAGAYSMFNAVTHNPLDIVTLDTKDKIDSLFAEVKSSQKEIKTRRKSFCKDFKKFCESSDRRKFCQEIGEDLGEKFDRECKSFAEVKSTALFKDFKTYDIEVGFDLLFDQDKRRILKNIETTWVLSDAQIEMLKEAGATLLDQSPEFAKLLTDLRNRIPE